MTEQQTKKFDLKEYLKHRTATNIRIKIPKSLKHCRRDQIGLATFHLINQLDKIEKLKERAKEEKYQNTCQIRVHFSDRFNEALEFIKAEYNLSAKEVVTCALLLEEGNGMFFG